MARRFGPGGSALGLTNTATPLCLFLVWIVVFLLCSRAGIAQDSVTAGTSEPPDLQKTASFKPDRLEPFNPAQVYILAIGTCVPYYEDRRDLCRNGIESLVRAVKAKMAIPAENVKMLIDKEGTYDGVVEGLRWLSCVTKPDDTAVIMYVGHGDRIPDQNNHEEDGQDQPLRVLALWSDEKPKTKWHAVNTKTWMLANDFNLFLRMIRANQRIIIMDTCHGAGMIKPLPSSRDEKKTAFLSSSLKDEMGGITRDKQWPLFTTLLIEAINNGAASLLEAFKVASEVTIKESRILCAEKKEGTKCVQQTPLMVDPHGLTARFTFSK